MTSTKIGSKRRPRKSISKYLGGDDLIQRSKLQKKGNQHRSQSVYEELVGLVVERVKNKIKSKGKTETGSTSSSVNFTPEIPELTGPLR